MVLLNYILNGKLNFSKNLTGIENIRAFQNREGDILKVKAQSASFLCS